MDQPVILCGLGRVGARVLEYLRTAGLPVVVVDNSCQPDDPRLLGAQLIQGDCRQRKTLEQAGVAGARGVLILTSDDLVNVSTTLMVRALDTQVRIVVRVFNHVLMLRLGKAVANVIPLSTSALTAPVVALTALTGETLGAFSLEDGRRQVADVHVTAGSPLVGQTVAAVAQSHRALVVAHCVSGGKQQLLLDVDPQAALAEGDKLVVCGDPRDLAGLLNQGDDADFAPRWFAWLRRQGRMAWATLRQVDLSVLICTSVLIFVVLCSTLIYKFGIYDERHSLVDGLYRTISVMATGADMNEPNVKLGTWQKVFVSGLRIFGAAVVAAFTAIVTNFLIRAHLGNVLEIRRIPDGGHVVVCGLGNLGFRVMEELLRAGERVVVIDPSRDGRFLASARRAGVPVIASDAAVQDVLRQANIVRARALVVTVHGDLPSLEIALLAREINPHLRVVVRLAEPTLAQTLREAANIRFALSIPILAAPAFVAALFGDRVQTLFLVGTQQLAVIELAVQTQDPFLAEHSVRTLTRDYGLLLVSLARANRALGSQTLEDRLQPGDRLTVIATLANLERLLRRQPPPADYVVAVRNGAEDTDPTPTAPHVQSLSDALNR